MLKAVQEWSAMRDMLSLRDEQEWDSTTRARPVRAPAPAHGLFRCRRCPGQPLPLAMDPVFL